jgi:hypothetical protein
MDRRDFVRLGVAAGAAAGVTGIASRASAANIHTLVLALLMFVASTPSLACSPPAQRDASGFVRNQVDRLPKNALGVMFAPASGVPRPVDFRVLSAGDNRPLVLRVRSFKDRYWVRLELVGGFRSGARYQFRYLPAHGNWLYPDQMSVAIDDAVALTRGRYAIELAPRPAYRVLTVPTSSGSCVEPSPAVAQEFTYAVPPSLAQYGDVLAYDAGMVFGPGAPAKPRFADDWADAPSLYVMGGRSLGRGFSQRYNARHNVVVADCGKRSPRIRLSAWVSFPEVDEVAYRTPSMEVDLNRNVDGQCGQLEALLQTVDARWPEPAFREVCRPYLGMEDRPLREIELDEWVRDLGFFSYGMAPTCHLVALAHLWHTGQYDMRPETLARLGTALGNGMGRAKQTQKDAAVHALAYLVDHLPPATQVQAARQLLAPVRPILIAMLAEVRPMRSDDLARLISWSGEVVSQ